MLDVRDADQVEIAVSRSNPDVLFNCAGFVHAGTILDCTGDDWDVTFDLNCKAMFILMKTSLPGMLKKGKGSIINMSSALSCFIGAPNRFLYTASKAAVVGMTKAISSEYVSQGIRCNCICPGTVDTPSLKERLEATGNYEKARAEFITRQPMGRIASPEEIAALVVYLASDESAFVTGQTHVIDGGWISS